MNGCQDTMRRQYLRLCTVRQYPMLVSEAGMPYARQQRRKAVGKRFTSFLESMQSARDRTCLGKVKMGVGRLIWS